MKVKIKDPFIYFLIEPTIVFVYEVENAQYLTSFDMGDFVNSDLFEIPSTEAFDTFNHKDGKVFEDGSFGIDQDGMNTMIEEINRVIQQKSQGNHQKNPVHIVTSESAAGSLRVALQHPKAVIGFPEVFSVGPLWKLDEEIGRNNRTEWLFLNVNDEQEDGQYEQALSIALREIEDITDEAPIYIWAGNNADEQVALRFYLHLLRGKPNEIYVLTATETGQGIFHTGQMEAESLTSAFNEQKENPPLTEIERLQYEREWKELAETQDLLRLWEANQIISVAANYYDTRILEVLKTLHERQETKDFIQAGTLIGELPGDADAYIDYYFAEYRIRHLVYSGVLELKGIPKSARHYYVKL